MSDTDWLLEQDFDGVLNTIEPIGKTILEESFAEATNDEISMPALVGFSRIISKLAVFNLLCNEFRLTPEDYPEWSEMYSTVRKRVCEDLSSEIELLESKGKDVVAYTETLQRVKTLLVWS